MSSMRILCNWIFSSSVFLKGLVTPAGYLSADRIIILWQSMFLYVTWYPNWMILQFYFTVIDGNGGLLWGWNEIQPLHKWLPGCITFSEGRAAMNRRRPEGAKANPSMRRRWIIKGISFVVREQEMLMWLHWLASSVHPGFIVARTMALKSTSNRHVIAVLRSNSTPKIRIEESSLLCAGRWWR